MMVPGQVTIIPLFLIMKQLGWVDTHLAIIVPGALFNAFAVFLLRQFIRGIPKEMEEAATIDGCSRWRIYWQIILPRGQEAGRGAGAGADDSVSRGPSDEREPQRFREWVCSRLDRRGLLADCRCRLRQGFAMQSPLCRVGRGGQRVF
jgi:hypothetical protein